jgi:pimeloyl-ACP methyl ester carboxylesterase
LAIAESMLPKMFAPDTYNTHPSLITDVRAMMAQTSVAGLVGALQGMKNRADSSSLLPLIQVPTLVIHGADDQLISLTVAQDMSAAIPGANLMVIPGAGHLLNLEQPDMFNQAVHEFLMESSQDV